MYDMFTLIFIFAALVVIATGLVLMYIKYLVLSEVKTKLVEKASFKEPKKKTSYRYKNKQKGEF